MIGLGWIGFDTSRLNSGTLVALIVNFIFNVFARFTPFIIYIYEAFIQMVHYQLFEKISTNE